MRSYKIFFTMLLAGTLIIACKSSKTSQKTEPEKKYTTEYTYTKNIKAIIDPSCGTKCHRAEKQAGGIDLSTFEGVQNATLHGKLIAAIKHEPDAKPMPPNGVKMDTIFVQMIEDWAKGGAPQ